MELKFNKNENAGSWVAEFEATADFNLHIEGVIARNVSVLQKTAGGKYDVVHDLPENAPLDNVMDYDFTALIYPKTIKVVCKDEPTYAEVISEGEIVEMKFQEKVVDVTANGSTVVTPDAGFTGLSKVSVKVDVPSSGGGGDAPSGGGESSWRYFSLAEGWDSMTGVTVVISLSQLIYVKNDSNNSVFSGAMASIFTNKASIKKFAFDASMRTKTMGDEPITFDELISLSGMSEDMFLSFVGATEITKEEFYTTL